MHLSQGGQSTSSFAKQPNAWLSMALLATASHWWHAGFANARLALPSGGQATGSSPDEAIGDSQVAHLQLGAGQATAAVR